MKTSIVSSYSLAMVASIGILFFPPAVGARVVELDVRVELERLSDWLTRLTVLDAIATRGVQKLDRTCLASFGFRSRGPSVVEVQQSAQSLSTHQRT